MKLSIVSLCLCLGTGLSACGPAGNGASSSGNQPAVNFTGTYTLGASCNGSTGVLSVSKTAISFNGVQCNIDKATGLNSASSQYQLSNCVPGDKQLPNRKITISEIEDGMVSLSGWETKDLALQSCG